jgi:hypothetical protein
MAFLACAAAVSADDEKNNTTAIATKLLHGLHLGATALDRSFFHA